MQHLGDSAQGELLELRQDEHFAPVVIELVEELAHDPRRVRAVRAQRVGPLVGGRGEERRVDGLAARRVRRLRRTVRR